MRIAITFFMIFFAIVSAGQTLSRFREILALKDVVALNNYIDTSKPEKRSLNNLNISWKLQRDITPVFSEGIIEIEQFVPDTSRPRIRTYYAYRINLISTGNKIIYYDFGEQFGSPFSDDFELEITDSLRNYAMLDSFKLSFQKLYRAILNNEELFIDKNVFGHICNDDASKPLMRQQIDSLVKARNVGTLDKWLRSANAEKQAYAIDGLIQLRRKGFKLTKDQLDLIVMAKHKKGNLRMCIGCIHFTTSIGVVIEDIIAGRKY